MKTIFVFATLPTDGARINSVLAVPRHWSMLPGTIAAARKFVLNAEP